MYHRNRAVFILTFPLFLDGDDSFVQTVVFKGLIALEALRSFHICCVVGESLYGSVFMDHHQMNFLIQRIVCGSTDLLQSIAARLQVCK